MEDEKKPVKRKILARRIRSVSDVTKALTKAYNEFRQEKLNENQAKTQGYLLNIILDALRGQEVENRVKEIEAKIAELREIRENRIQKAA